MLVLGGEPTITKLSLLKDPLTRVEYDLILVIVNRLLKYTIFIPYLELLIIEQFANTIIRVLVANFGILV